VFNHNTIGKLFQEAGEREIKIPANCVIIVDNLFKAWYTLMRIEVLFFLSNAF